MKPQPEHPPPEPPEASPFWPLLVLLGEIASRVEREQVAKGRVKDATSERAQDAG